MPEDLYGAVHSTVASTSDTVRVARPFEQSAQQGASVRDAERQPALRAVDFIAEYRAACAQTDRLFAAVLPEFLSSRPVPERHRLLFYIGHLEAFDWNLLAARALGQTAFHPEFDHLFAFGIDPVGGGLPTDVPEDWPTLDAIHRYRDTVRNRIETAIAHVDFSDWVMRVPEDHWSDVDAVPDAVSGARTRAIVPDRRSGDNTGVSIGTLCLVALEHRQMHAETLAYLIHQMPYAHKRAPDDASATVRTDAYDALNAHRQASTRASRDAFADGPGNASARDGADAGHGRADSGPMCSIPAGSVTMGLPGTFTSDATHEDTPDDSVSNAGLSSAAGRFGWDNEWVDPTAAVVTVPAFQIDKWMVTNGAFLRFVEAGGYDDPSWWREEDWAWRQMAGISHPAFWERDVAAPNGWRWRGMFAPLALPLDWPVYVSHAEAAAYARFVGKRLPTEAEWLRAAEGVPGLPYAASSDDGLQSLTASASHGMAAADGFSGNADFRRWDPDAVDRYPENRSSFDVIGQFGNGWEWTADTFAPFKGFKAFPFYRGYSADFFDTHHFVMKGGSPRTAARMLRPSFRNWFQAHYPYVYAGFRCVR